MEDNTSATCRKAAFDWLREQARPGNETLTRDSLARGFPHQGSYVKLVGPQGIFKPAQIQYFPLSITTTTKGPYSDSFDPSGDYLLYSYRGTDPGHHENQRLRDAMRDRVPLIYFYSTAYREQCSICRLRHADLLDAAHITPDSDEGGEPVISNGLSLCKIHHAAYDRDYFGIQPNYHIVVRPAIMREEDGPMLKAGLQQIDESKLVLPRSVRDRPDPERLQKRFDRFANSAL